MWAQLQQELDDQRTEQRQLLEALPAGITDHTPAFALGAVTNPAEVERTLRNAAVGVLDANDEALRGAINARRDWWARWEAHRLVLNKVDRRYSAMPAIQAVEAAMKLVVPAGEEPMLEEHKEAAITFLALATAADAVAKRADAT